MAEFRDTAPLIAEHLLNKWHNNILHARLIWHVPCFRKTHGNYSTSTATFALVKKLYLDISSSKKLIIIQWLSEVVIQILFKNEKRVQWIKKCIPNNKELARMNSCKKNLIKPIISQTWSKSNLQLKQTSKTDKNRNVNYY